MRRLTFLSARFAAPTPLSWCALCTPLLWAMFAAGAALAQTAAPPSDLLTTPAQDIASPTPAAPAPASPTPTTPPAAIAAPTGLNANVVAPPVVANVSADPTAAMPTDAPAANVPKDSCANVSDRAMASDLRAATAQTKKTDAAQLARLVDESIALWTLAVQRCEGRGQERARRNLADSERSRQALAAQLGASPACTAGQKDASSLQELAQQAVRERRWLDAAVMYRKAENMWDVTAERCTGNAQQTALQRRDQTATDAHNAEFCAPVFEQARQQSQHLRRLGGERASPEHQTHSQAAETLWREATGQCRGAAQEMARSNAEQIARERGTPWVATAVPGVAAALALQTDPAAVSAQTQTTTLAPTPAPAPHPVRSAPSAPIAPAPAVAPPAVPAAAPAMAAASIPASTAGPANNTPQDMDLQAGDTRFVGRFMREGNLLTGKGQIKWANGDLYEGDIVKGQRHGQGRFLWASGQSYSGPWVHDAAQGKGQMRFANGDDFEGEVSQGQPHGPGRMRYASGDQFEGQFTHGKPDGQGSYRWANGQSYEGPWANEQPHGLGKLKFASGNVWEGQLQRGHPEGSGRLTFATGDVYEGEVSQGLPHGQGRYRWTNGDQYQGQWQQGHKHGQGRMQWANGDAWEGRFDNDAQSGESTLTRQGG